MGLDARAEATVARLVCELQAALGDRLVAAALYGSAATDDWMRGRSDINVAIVVTAADARTLDAIVPTMRRWRRQGGTLPLVLEPGFLARAGEVFPMEIADIAARHRVLVGEDPFAGLTVSIEALWRELAQEARGKLLRLRAGYLEAARSPGRLEALLLGSLTSYLTILRHLGRVELGLEPHGFAAAIEIGEQILGPLPAMHQLLEHRTAPSRAGRRRLGATVADYLAEVERLVARCDAHL